MADFNNGAEFLRPDEHDGMPILFWDLPETPEPRRRRPPRKGRYKRWVRVQYFRWVYPGYGEDGLYRPPHTTSRIVEEFRWVQLPLVQNPIREWDR